MAAPALRTAESGEKFVAQPWALAPAEGGGFYFIDGNRVRALSEKGAVRTVCGQAEEGFEQGKCGVDRPRFKSPLGLAAHAPSTRIFVADTGNNVIRMITGELALSTLAGAIDATAGSLDGGGVAALLAAPCALALARGPGLLFFTDRDSGALRRVDLWSDEAAASAAAAAAVAPGGAEWDGEVPAAPAVRTLSAAAAGGPLLRPCGVALDEAAGVIFVADTGNAMVRGGELAGAASRAPAALAALAAAAPLPLAPVCGNGTVGADSGVSGARGAEATLSRPGGLLALSFNRGLLIADAGFPGVRDSGRLALLRRPPAGGGAWPTRWEGWSCVTVAGLGAPGEPAPGAATAARDGPLGANTLAAPNGLLEVNSSLTLVADRAYPGRVRELRSATFAFGGTGAIRLALLFRPAASLAPPAAARARRALQPPPPPTPPPASPGARGVAAAHAPRFRAALASALGAAIAGGAYGAGQDSIVLFEGASDEGARGLRATVLLSYAAVAQSQLLPGLRPTSTRTQMLTSSPSATRGASGSPSGTPAAAAAQGRVLAALAAGLPAAAAQAAALLAASGAGALGAVFGNFTDAEISVAVDVAPPWAAAGGGAAPWLAFVPAAAGDPRPAAPAAPQGGAGGGLAGLPQWALYAGGGGAVLLLVLLSLAAYVRLCGGRLPCMSREIRGVEFSKTRALFRVPPRVGPTAGELGALQLREYKRSAAVAEKLGLSLGHGGE